VKGSTLAGKAFLLSHSQRLWWSCCSCSDVDSCVYFL